MSRPVKKGYTLIELLVVVTIIVILAGLLMTGINKAIARSAYVTCQNNLKQLGGMIIDYALRNNGMMPEFTEYRWIGQIGFLEGGENGWKDKSEYEELRDNGDVEDGSYFIIKNRENRMFVCPTGQKQMMNLQGVRSNYTGVAIRDYQSIDSIDDPIRTMLLLEYDGNDNNIVFADESDEITYLTDSIKRPDPGATVPAELYTVALNHGDGDCGNVFFIDRYVECVQGDEALVLTWEEDYSTTSTTTSTSTTSTSTTTTSSRSTTSISASSSGGSSSSGSSSGVGGSSGGSSSGQTGSSGSGSSSGASGSGGVTSSGASSGGGSSGNNSSSPSSSVAPTSSPTSAPTSVSTTVSTSSTTVRRYLGPPF